LPPLTFQRWTLVSSLFAAGLADGRLMTGSAGFRGVPAISGFHIFGSSHCEDIHNRASMWSSLCDSCTLRRSKSNPLCMLTQVGPPVFCAMTSRRVNDMVSSSHRQSPAVNTDCTPVVPRPDTPAPAARTLAG
jgi:hypothetical protein